MATMNVQFFQWSFLLICQFHAAAITTTLPTSHAKYDVLLTLDGQSKSVEVETTVNMYTKYGQMFSCHIPVLSNENSSAEVILPNNTHVLALLSLNTKSNCFVMQKDWWTYEVCPYRHVLQFHEERKKRMSEILLGRYDSETDWSDSSSINISRPLMHLQWYKNGSFCDVAYRQRRVEVRYLCADDGGPSAIRKVEEVESCVYRIDISISALCTHPSFTPKPVTKIERVICTPKNSHTTGKLGGKRTPKDSRFRGQNAQALSFFMIARRRRSSTDYRIISRLMRKFLRTLSEAIPPTVSVGFSNAFPLHLESAQFNPTQSVPFSFSVERSELQQWVDHGQILISDFQFFLEKVLAKSPEANTSLSQAVPIVRSLTTILSDLLRRKWEHLTNPNSTFEVPVLQQFSHAARIFIGICKELLRNLDSNMVHQLQRNLESMYSDPEFSSSLNDSSLNGSNVNSTTSVHIRLATKHRRPLFISPEETLDLRHVHRIFRNQAVLLDELNTTLSGSDSLHQLASMIVSSLHNLLGDPQSRVLVFRGFEEADDGFEEGFPINDATRRPLSQGVVAMLTKFLRKAAPELSENLEIYHTDAGKGLSTLFIMYGQEKHKEEKRMKKLEDAYKYTGSHVRDRGRN